MVLDLDHGDAGPGRELMGEGARVVERMRVADDELGRELEKLRHAGDRLLERVDAPHVGEVANVGGHVHEATAREAERVLELAADGEDRRRVIEGTVGHEGQRRIAPRAAHHVGATVVPGHDRVVRPETDLPVVREHDVAHAPEVLEDVLVVAADRGALGVRARHHEAVAHRPPVRVAEDEELDRGVGQHDTDPRVVGGDRRRHPRGGPAVLLAMPLEEEDRLVGTVEDLLLPGKHHALAANGGKVGEHDREGLERPVLEGAQSGDGLLVRGVAAQVEAADALDRGDAAVPDHVPRADDRVGTAQAGLALGEGQREDLGTAVVAADGLGVVAPRGGVGVLARAVLAHRELRHARALAVVGHRVEDRDAGAAGGAVDEGMQVAPVARVKELPLARIADGDVG